MLQERYDFIINYFKSHSPNAASELGFNNAFELLVAVILSAQCTDKRVNMVTPSLFAAFPSPQTLANATVDDIFQFIKSISYPNNKAKHLSLMAKMLVDKYNGQVPDTLEELQQLPGVGRKTANVVLSVVFNQPAMAVDTHVFRVAHRLGLVENANTPLEVEKQLVRHFPVETIALAHHWLILHGRYVCLARKPNCNSCGLAPVCLYYAQNDI